MAGLRVVMLASSIVDDVSIIVNDAWHDGTTLRMTGGLAERLKALRAARRWSLRDAAARSGVSKSMLSKIERAQAAPTATVLGRLAEGFGVSISQLLAQDGPTADVVLMARADQPVFRVPASGFERRSLSPAPAGGVDLAANILPPGQSSGEFPAHRAGVEETLAVVSGRLIVQLGDARYLLAAGDALFYRAQVAHRFDNPSQSEPAVFLIVVNNLGR